MEYNTWWCNALLAIIIVSGALKYIDFSVPITVWFYGRGTYRSKVVYWCRVLLMSGGASGGTRKATHDSKHIEGTSFSTRSAFYSVKRKKTHRWTKEGFTRTRTALRYGIISAGDDIQRQVWYPRSMKQASSKWFFGLSLLASVQLYIRMFVLLL